MASPGIVTLFVIVALGTIATVIVVPIVSASDWTIPPSELNESPHPLPYSIRMCDPLNKVAQPLATNERELSTRFFNQDPTEDVPDERGLSMWVMTFGQFIDHDIVRSQSDPTLGTFVVPFNTEINITMTRVKQTPTSMPLNEISPYIDGTTVYGDYSDPTRMQQLRDGCKLKTDSYNLPTIQDGAYFCGDTRCGEHVTLTILHTLFVREHNRLCDAIAEVRPLLTIEERYRVARKTVIAEIQHITYSHWLPALLGSQYPLIKQDVTSSDVRMSVPFSVSAYRFGHSMVPNNVGPYPLSSLFFNNAFLKTYGVDSTIIHATATRAQKVDLKVVDSLRNILFGEHGMDLVTLNLFRQRELYVPRYTQLCQCFGVEPQFEPGLPHDLDPYIGILGETLVPGSSLGPLAGRIVSDQFARLRANDPNFYTLPHVREQIGPSMWDIVKSTTLSELVRRNTNIKSIKPDMFYF
jgi:hypothetical protein